MGGELIAFYRDRVKKNWKQAFVVTFVACLLIHIYKFTNTLPNHDSMYNDYSSQDITGSGRWFLQYACGISSYFDLPWINGLLCAVYLGAAAAVIVEIFQITNPVVIALSGMILAASPCTTETLFFGYTADGYLLGLLLSALSALLSCAGKGWKQNLISGICLCLSLAIYQAYVSFAAVLCVCYLICRILNGEETVKSVCKWVSRHILLYGAAMAAYYLIWKLLLAAKGMQAVEYQGISAVGHITVATIVNGAINSVRNLALFFLEWNILEHPVSAYSVLNIAFLIGFGFVLIKALIRSKVIRKPMMLMMVLICLAACVPIISIWNFTSDSVIYRPMMMHSVCVLYIFALVLFEKWVGTRASTWFGLLTAVIVFNFALMANIAYSYLDKCYQKSYYMGMELMGQIQQYEDIHQIAFIGHRGESVSLTEESHIDSIHIFSGMLEEDLLYDHSHAYLYLKNTFGMEIPEAPPTVIWEIESRTEAEAMESWPADSAVKVFDDILVIKLGEIS